MRWLKVGRNQSLAADTFGRELQQTDEAVQASLTMHSPSCSNVFSNRREMSDFEGLCLGDVELLTTTQLTEQLFCEWRAQQNRLCLEKLVENLV